MRWGTFSYNGIDRVDNALGYLPSNCVPCCWDCNQAKANRTSAEFLAWAERLHQHQHSHNQQSHPKRSTA